MKADFEKYEKNFKKNFLEFWIFSFLETKGKMLDLSKKVINFNVSTCWYPYATQRIGSSE